MIVSKEKPLVCFLWTINNTPLGILITDQNGKDINLEDLNIEHNKAFISTKIDKPGSYYTGPTAILISKI